MAGDPGGNTEAAALTEEGRAQACSVGRALAHVSFQRVITSGMPRADETAALILAEQDVSHGVPERESRPELQELMPGNIAAIPDADLSDAYVGLFRPGAPRDGRFLGGESLGSMVDRVNACLDGLMADDNWDTVLLVLHGAVNRAIISRALTGRHEFFGHIEQSPGCINVLDHGPEWVVRAVNVTPYDVAQNGPRTTTVERLLQQCREARRAPSSA